MVRLGCSTAVNSEDHRDDKIWDRNWDPRQSSNTATTQRRGIEPG